MSRFYKIFLWSRNGQHKTLQLKDVNFDIARKRTCFGWPTSTWKTTPFVINFYTSSVQVGWTISITLHSQDVLKCFSKNVHEMFTLWLFPGPLVCPSRGALSLIAYPSRSARNRKCYNLTLLWKYSNCMNIFWWRGRGSKNLSLLLNQIRKWFQW